MRYDDLEEILDDEWYENVSNAITYAMNELPETINPERVFGNIVEYNVRRKVHEYLVKNGTKTLPKALNWRKKTISEAFQDYKCIIDTCDICTNFRSFTFHIKFGENSGELFNKFILWRELTNTYYENIKVFSKLTDNDCKVMIRRWKKD